MGVAIRREHDERQSAAACTVGQAVSLEQTIAEALRRADG